MSGALFSTGLHLLLAEHHRALETVCADLRGAVYADETCAVVDRHFEHAVILQLEIEEHELLPEFGEVFPLEAEAIRSEQRTLRDELYRLGVDVELHQARAERFERLVGMLKLHLEVEESTLFPWVETFLAMPARRTVFTRIGRSLFELGKVHQRRAA